MTFNKNHQPLTDKNFQWGLVFFGTLIFLVPAIWNGFPFIFTDTLSYMVSGIDLIAPPDRPIFYGIYIRITNLFFDLWGGVICQAALLSLLLVKFVKKLFPSLSVLSLCLWLIFITFFTTAPWFVGQISPDIFSSILFLALMFWVVSYKEENTIDLVIVCSTLILSICVHSSNLLICTFTASVFFIWLVLQRQSWKYIRKFSLPIFSSILISVVLIIISNIWSHYGATLNPSGRVFMLARILEDGPGLEFLKNNCTYQRFKVCEALPMLVNAKEIEIAGNVANDPELKNLVASTFLWGGGLSISGGIFSVNSEAGAIIKGAVKEYPFVQIKAIAQNTLDQLVTFSVGEQLKSTLKLEAINHFFHSRFPGSYQHYLNSQQSRGKLPVVTNFLNPIYFVVVLLAIANIAITLFIQVRKGISTNYSFIVIGILFIFEVANAMVTGALSGVFDRYQSRVIWLIPAVSILFLLNSSKSRLFRAV